MIHWREIPFVKICLALIAGMLFREWGFHWNILLFVSLAGIFICLWLIAGNELKSKSITSILMLTGISFFGWALHSLSDERLESKHISRLIPVSSAIHAQGYIINSGTTSTGKQKLEVKLLSLNGEGKPEVECNGKIVLYLSEEATLPNPVYGDVLTFEGHLQEIPENPNPYAFDYKKYMSRKGIYYQCFIKEDIQLSGKIEGNNVYRFADQFRQYCLNILSFRISDISERSVAAALLLGYKEWIPDQVKNEYVETGATHVLAVSGLHVGIIAGMILWLFKGLRRNDVWFRALKCMLALLALWSFALISGLSPSVMRATIMFSFVLLARLLLKKGVNLFNIISLSAFLLLVANPNILFDLGFQLSYAALLGIICFQSWIYRLIYVPSPTQKIWNLISVSMAAQIGTLPFTLYYFHQFPIYFWLSGLFVVPLAAVIMLLGMATLILHPFSDFLASMASYLLSYSTWLMNQSVYLISKLPWAVSDGIWISFIQSVVLLLAIGLFARGIQPIKSGFLSAGLVCLACFLSIFIVDDFRKSGQQILFTYEVKKGIVLDYFEGKNCICITDMDTNSREYSMAVMQNRIAHKIKDCRIVRPDDEWSTAGMEFKSGKFIMKDIAQNGPQQLDNLSPSNPEIISMQTASVFDLKRLGATSLILAESENKNLAGN